MGTGLFNRIPSYHVDVDASLVSQDYGQKLSVVYWRMFVVSTGSGGYWASTNNGNTGWVDSNVGRLWYNPNMAFDFRNGTTFLIAEGTFNVPHRADGTAEYEVIGTLNLVSLGTASAGTGTRVLPTLAKVPDAPTPIGFSDITQNAIRYHFAGGSDGGAPILEWQALWQDATINGPQISYISNGYTILGPGLTPGHTYNFWSRGRNAVGWGPWSTPITTRTIAGARVLYAGQWREAVPYVKRNGAWKLAQPYSKVKGVWKKSI
jgi:Fibronectin type III domain